jgi:hypothetical protein
MNAVIEEIVKEYASFIETDVKNINISDKTRTKIARALLRYTKDEILNAFTAASTHPSLQTPERFNLAYLCTPEVIAHWVAIARKHRIDSAFSWDVPQHMNSAQWMADEVRGTT